MTICTQKRDCFFGAVVDGRMQLNDAGRLAQTSWMELPLRFPTISLDAFVVMPNHVHGVVRIEAQFIARADSRDAGQGAMNRAPTSDRIQQAKERVAKLGEIVRAYKASSARVIRAKADGTFAWQRNYFEHVILNEESLNRIRKYIQDNPPRWDVDRENPSAVTPEAENAWDMSR